MNGDDNFVLSSVSVMYLFTYTDSMSFCNNFLCSALPILYVEYQTVKTISFFYRDIQVGGSLEGIIEFRVSIIKRR